MAKTTNGRNGKIEFLRFLFALIIVIHHSRYLLGDTECMFLGGSLAVDFFYIVSGYLMMATIEKRNMQGAHQIGLGKETLSFVLRKAKAIYPDALIAWIIAVIFISCVKQNSLLQTVLLFADSIFEVTFLKMSGLTATSVNGVTWYISSMLLCMALLYPLIRKHYDVMVHIGLPLIVVLVFGYLCGAYGAPRNPTMWIGFTYKGNLRALAEISLGAICYQVVKKLSNVSFTNLGRVLLTILEWGLYILVILYMYYCKAGVRDYLFLLFIAAAVSLSFLAKGIDSEWYDRSVFFWLGRYSLPLFLGHTYYAQNLNSLLPVSFTNGQRMIVYMLCTIVTASVIWGVSTFIKTVYPRIKKAVATLLLESSEPA